MISNLLNFFFPSQCVVCGIYGQYLCVHCYSHLVKHEKIPVCHVCKSIRHNYMNHKQCLTKTALTSIEICFERNIACKKLIVDLKYNLYFDIASYISSFYISRLSKLYKKEDSIILVPVPLHKKKLWNRGFNQTFLISEKIAEYFSWSVKELLIRKKNTRTQVGLQRLQREKNLQEVFEVKHDTVTQKAVFIIVDDIMTTGTTLEMCAAALKKAYPNEIHAIVFYRD